MCQETSHPSELPHGGGAILDNIRCSYWYEITPVSEHNFWIAGSYIWQLPNLGFWAIHANAGCKLLRLLRLHCVFPLDSRDLFIYNFPADATGIQDRALTVKSELA